MLALIHVIALSSRVLLICKNLGSVLWRNDLLLLFGKHGSMVWYDRRPLYIIHL